MGRNLQNPQVGESFQVGAQQAGQVVAFQVSTNKKTKKNQLNGRINEYITNSWQHKTADQSFWP